MRLLLVVAITLASLGATPRAEEQRTWTTADGTVRIILNKPADFDEKRPTELICFATPNGNTAEQTLGAKLEPGMDWHYDIQHVAAQVRKLRDIDKSRNLVLACLQADTKSWPAWRKAHADNGKQIRAIVEEVSRAVPGPVHISLMAHSGGGSFIFGYINGAESIPDSIDRIAFLDANYGYDEADHHGEKLFAWLKGDPNRHMVVIAYDDSQITLNGKPVLKTPMGGTFGSSRRMIDYLAKQTDLKKSDRGPFESWIGMNGQIRFLIHTNVEKKILHTVLVERNGVLEALTLGTPLENKWGGEFWGERAYADFIEPLPTTAPSTSPAAAVKPQATGIPPRPANAPGGKAFAESIADLPRAARENAIVAEVLRGNIPDFLRKFVTVRIDNAAYEVMPDYLAIGSDADFVRMPMNPHSATIIADAFGCTLPTRKMVNDIYAAAEVKVEPRPMTKDRDAVETFVQHNDIIEQQRADANGKLGQLIAGHKKDVVITNRLKQAPTSVAIYGWHKLDGKPIQTLYTGHVDWYVDYSHGIRLVKQTMTVDGKPRQVADVLRDAEWSKLLSDEGSIDAGYPQ